MGKPREIDLYWHKITETVDELVACLEGLDGEALDWKPLDDANSLYVLATHTMGNVRHNFLSILCGGPITRDRDSKFAAMGDSVAEIEAVWNDLQGRISEAIRELPPDDLDRVRDDPQRGKITGRELMILVARHAAEHHGQAQLTRDLVKARQSG